MKVAKQNKNDLVNNSSPIKIPEIVYIALASALFV